MAEHRQSEDEDQPKMLLRMNCDARLAFNKMFSEVTTLNRWDNSYRTETFTTYFREYAPLFLD
jgi:hypothetical protein